MKENLVGKGLKDYDSMLVLSHFKGHPAGGYGGALKQLAIGCASSKGRSLIHSDGFTDDQTIVWDHMAKSEVFCEVMADAAGSIMEYFSGNTAFINMMCNLSVDCDCCAVAEDPCMEDIGILSSMDLVALDQACMDLIYQSKDSGRDHFLHRVESLKGTHTIDAAAAANQCEGAWDIDGTGPSVPDMMTGGSRFLTEDEFNGIQLYKSIF